MVEVSVEYEPLEGEEAPAEPEEESLPQTPADGRLGTCVGSPWAKHAFWRAVSSVALDTFVLGGTLIPDTQIAKTVAQGSTSQSQMLLTLNLALEVAISFLLQPPLGAYSDARGRRAQILLIRFARVLQMLGQLGLVMVLPSLTFWRLYILSIPIKAVAGFCSLEMTVHTQCAIAADCFPPEDRAWRMGQMNGFVALAMILSQVSSAVLLKFTGLVGVFSVASVLACGSFAFTHFGMPETRFLNESLSHSHHLSSRDLLAIMLNPLRDVKLLLHSDERPEAEPDLYQDKDGESRNVAMWRLLFVHFVQGFNHYLLSSTVIFFLEEEFGVPAERTPVFIMYYGIIGMLLMFFGVKWALKNLGEWGVLRFSCTLCAMGALGLAFSYNIPIFCISLVLFSAHFLLLPATNSSASKQVSKSKQGFLMGAFGSVKSLGILGGTLVGGSVYSYFAETSFPIPGAQFVVAAAMALLALVATVEC